MRLAFAGTPDFAVPALDALHADGHDIAAVFTQPDRPAGRGQKLADSAVARRAQALGLAVHKPHKLDEGAQAILRALAPEAMVVVAYGLILPRAVLEIPARGCLNIHASLLPRWRGAAPIQRALLAGDGETGVTIMRMDAGLDTGPMLLRSALPVGPDQTAGELHDALAVLGAGLIVSALRELAAGTLAATPQPADGVTHAPKLSKDEARIDWSQPADQIARRVRAFNPVPVAWTELDGERLRILRARPLADAAARGAVPGEILESGPQGILVATGGGALAIEQLQFAGGRVLAAAQAAGRALVGRRLR